MRTDLPAPADPTLQAPAPVAVTIYPSTAELADVVAGSAAGGVDLAGFVESIEQSDREASIGFAYHGAEFTRPKPDQPLTISRAGFVIFSGLVDTVSAERLARGERVCTATVRRRDAFPAWRDVHRVTPTYTVGMDLGLIARDMAGLLGLVPSEYDLPDLGVTLSHGSTQLADVTAWDVLQTVGAPALREPFVDALGRLKWISRDPRRPADRTLTQAEIASVEIAGSRPPINTFRVKYLDPKLSRVYQRVQLLTTANLTCAFWQPSQGCDVWWSEDHTLRADNVRLRVAQSAVEKLLVPWKIGTEKFTQTTPYGGKMSTHYDVLTSWAAEQMLGTALLAAYSIPEPVVTGGVGVSGGHTVPWYKAAAIYAAWSAVLNFVLSVGYGVYEFRGRPYDDVHAVNEFEAYDVDAAAWNQKVEEVENDLVPNDAVAEGFAVNELIYRSKAASGSTVTIADDPRIEPGDVLGLPDGRRLYVQGYSRSLGRGAEATLKLAGFMVP